MGANISGAGRLEDHRFLTGEGRFTADLRRDGEAHGYVLRSPHAHADIVSVDTADAAAMPGVLAVFTAADFTADGLGDLQNKSQIPSDPPMAHPPRPVLARGKVRHVGEAVAFVVAEEGFHDADGTGRDDLCSRLVKIGMAATGIGDVEEFKTSVLENFYVLESQYHKGQTWDDFISKYIGHL